MLKTEATQILAELSLARLRLDNICAKHVDRIKVLSEHAPTELLDYFADCLDETTLEHATLSREIELKSQSVRKLLDDLK